MTKVACQSKLVGRFEASKITGLHPDKLYAYGKMGLLVMSVVGKKRLYWLESVHLLRDMMQEAGGLRGWKQQMRREKQRLASDATAVPFWHGRVQALRSNGVPGLEDVSEGWEGMRPDGMYATCVAATAIGCSYDTVLRFIKSGRLVRARHGKVTGASLMSLVKEVKAAGGYSAYSRVLISQAAQKRVRRMKETAGLCHECHAVLAKAPTGNGVVCGWCLDDKRGGVGRHGRVRTRSVKQGV